MPASPSRATDGRARRQRLVGVALMVVFLALLAPAASVPVAGKDWTPQIQATRRAQIYWESLMRDADADLRGAKKAQRKAKRKLARIERRHVRLTEARSRERGQFERASARLSEARQRLAETEADAALSASTSSVTGLASDDPTRRDIGLLLLALASPADEPVPPPPGLTGPTSAAGGATTTLRPLEREVRQTKRSWRKAQRKSQRSARNARAAGRRIAALKAAERGAIARRETAERSLGAWILAMTKYGRIRAKKKSKARPGVSTPFGWPVHGRISQTYHAGHDGLDIVRYSGAPIRAAAFGVVTYVGWNPWDKEGRAFVVVITHATNYETAYGHLLPRRNVRVGQEVKKGEVIGYMGNTGKSTGTHLHFELRRGRTTVNPLGFL